MRGAVVYGPRDVRFEEPDVPQIINPTDAIIHLSASASATRTVHERFLLLDYQADTARYQVPPVGHSLLSAAVFPVSSRTTAICSHSLMIWSNRARRCSIRLASRPDCSALLTCA